MSNHRYKVNQTLNFIAYRTGLPPSLVACKIVRLMPTEQGSPVYRIKCGTEAFERTARETDLS